MRIEKTSETDFKIYIYADIMNTDDLLHDTGRFIKSLKKKLHLIGFYKVLVCKKKFGIFIILEKLEDSYYKGALDLKVVVLDELDVYFKTEDYFILKENQNIRFLDSYYYVLIDDYFDFSYDKFEFGDFVFGYDISKLLENNGIVI